MNGRYGVGTISEAGRDLIDWCEVNGLSFVNSFMHTIEGALGLTLGTVGGMNWMVLL